MKKKQAPVHRVKFGRVTAAIWENQTKEGDIFHSVTLTRSYRVNDEWKDTSSLGKNELPVAALVLQQAFVWLQEQSDAPASVDAEAINEDKVDADAVEETEAAPNL